MKSFKTIFLFMAVLVASCNHCDDETTIADLPNYHPLTAGSYWVYDWYHIDTLGNETPYNKRDSIYVEGDTLINGLTYAKLNGKAFVLPIPSFYRDSSGFLVNERGEILFAPLDFAGQLIRSDTIDILAVIDFRTEAVTTTISLPLGNFDCVNYQGTMTSLKEDYEWGVRPMPTYFADSIGIVLSRVFYHSSPDNLERRLVDYAIF